MYKVDILAIGVHPDDTELSCTGTILKHISLGKKVAIVDLTQGELGTRGSAKLRLEEAEASRIVQGIEYRENLGMADGFFQHSKENLIKIVSMIRKYQPEIVFANAISDRHPDHGRAAKLISDACFLSGLLKIRTNLGEEIQEKWRPKAVYHYIQDHNLKPDLIVDITGFLDKKLEAIACFKSQFFDPNSAEPETPISSKSFIDSIIAKNASYGRQIGVEHGEGFNVTRHIGVHNLFDLI